MPAHHGGRHGVAGTARRYFGSGIVVVVTIRLLRRKRESGEKEKEDGRSRGEKIEDRGGGSGIEDAVER